MILLELFLGFLQVGCFSFGGAYGAIPLIRDVALEHAWLDEETLTYVIALSESTPGPIMVNVATYVGSIKGGIIGAAIATTAVILPSFIIIILINILLKSAMQNKYVQATLRGLKPCVVGIVFAIGIYMIISNCCKIESGITIQVQSLIITCILALIVILYKRLAKKKLSPIMLIIVAAITGAVVYGI